MAAIASGAKRSVLGEIWDTTRMRLLVELERAGSVSAAAKAVGITQSTASEHVRLLESAAGQRLVERSGRGSQLNGAGRVLAARAAQALAVLDAGEEELADLAGLKTGTIHLGASTAPGVYLLPDTLGCFRRDYPAVRVDVEVAASGEIVARLLSGRIQLAIVGGADDPRLHLEPFVEDEIVGVAAPGLPGASDGVADSRSLEELMLLKREPGSSTQAAADAALEQAGIRPRGVWELGSSEAIKRAARAGLGVAFLSRYSVAEEVERGELLVFRLAGHAPLVRSFYVAHLASRTLSPSESAFVGTLRRCCAKSAAYAEACLAT
ncbi:MAG: LysR family transcriptional regulator [Gaiellaceae bacterium]